MIASILTVCVGNICRSPMAAELLKLKLPEVQVSSAGLSAMVGQPADEYAQHLIQKVGGDISPHRARQLNLSLCLGADVILVMEASQKREVENRYPASRGRVFRLGEAAGMDIFDPYRLPAEDFERCFDYISTGIDDWVKKITRLK